MSEPLPVSFTPRALKHLNAAAEWWRRNRFKAPDALTEDLEDALGLIASQPYIGAIARVTRLRDVRRVLLNRVRYYLYYRVRGTPAESIEIVAFWHVSRGSGPKI